MSSVSMSTLRINVLFVFVFVFVYVFAVTSFVFIDYCKNKFGQLIDASFRPIFYSSFSSTIVRTSLVN